MQATRKRFLAFVAIISSMVLAGATAYYFDFPPFASHGKIDATKVCEVLGASEQLVPGLRTALPQSSEYSFRNREKSGDLPDRQSSVFHCFVVGEDGPPRLLTSYTEMILAEGSEHWIKQYVNQQRLEDNELSDFKAGDKGVASIRTAGISVPCIPDGKAIGGQYNLSTVVSLKQDNDSDDDDTRLALIEIARSAAGYAHKKAKCELPSKL